MCLALAMSFGGASIAAGSPAGVTSSASICVLDGSPFPTWEENTPGYGPATPETEVTAQEPSGGETGRGYLIWDGRGPWGGNVKSLVQDPTNSGRIYCGAGLSAARESGGVWISTDSGVNWSDAGLVGMPAYMIAAPLSEPGVVYAAYYDGLYRSTDSGATWARIAFTAITIGVGVKANDGNVLIAGMSSNQGIKRSTDRGLTWQQVGLNTYYMKGFAVSPAAPERMYMAMSSAAAACYRSDDGGATWTAHGPATDGWGLWADPANGDHAILSTSNGIYITTNGGTDWNLTLSGTCYSNVSVKDGVIYAPIVGAGVYESTNGGSTWTSYSSGIVANFWYASTATPTGVLVGHYGGIYRTSAPASPWVVSQTGLNNAFVRTIVYYADRGELWAGTDQSGLWRSRDNGLTWELKSTGLDQWATYRLTPKDHEHGQGDRMFITTSTGVYRSTDHGESWALVGFGGTFMRGILIDPSNPNRVWTGTAVTQQIWRSENGGTTWNQVGTGITSGLYPDFNMGRNPSNGPRLFVSYEQSTGQIYYSDDLGSTFTAAPVGSTTYQASLTLHDADPSIVFCGTDTGVYKSTNYGVTWAASGLSNVIWSLLGTRTTDVYAGRNRTGVYVSHDNGASWVALNAGIEDQVMWDLCYGATTSDLFCSPRGRGVKMLSLEPPSDVREPGSTLVSRTAPNPFRDTATVQFDHPLAAGAQVRVFDAAGRVVRAERIEGVGITSWTWDGRDAAGNRLSGGIYFYEVLGRSDRITGRWAIAR
jgi:photosystem II stability/assembly factor-like uncharacterized protein